MADWLPVLLQIIAILAVAAIAYLLLRVASRVGVHRLLDRRVEDPEAEPLAALELERRVRTLERLGLRIAGVTITVVAVLMIMKAFLIDIGPAVAGLGVVGIAVGMGAQSLIRDWLAGVFVVLENQFNLGDVVRLAGVEGVVEDFSLRRTTVRDLDGALHSVPNGQIVVASNLARGWSRVNLDVAVSHDTDLQRVTEIVNRLGEELATEPEWAPLILEAPTVQRIAAVDESGVTLKVLGRVRPAQHWSVAGELRRRILAAFAGEGMAAPVRLATGGSG
jgi:small-conductance mechanosensitive channel